MLRVQLTCHEIPRPTAPRWKPSTSPWSCSWAGPGMLWRTLWSGTWWAGAAGRPSANSCHGVCVKPDNRHFLKILFILCGLHLHCVSALSSRLCLVHSGLWCFCRVVLSMPFAILSYVLLWFMPQDSMSQALSVPWFLVAACMFETLMSVRESRQVPLIFLFIFSPLPTHTLPNFPHNPHTRSDVLCLNGFCSISIMFRRPLLPWWQHGGLFTGLWNCCRFTASAGPV